MTITIEQSQRISDLRQHMLRNLQAGKPAQDGLTTEDLRQALEWIRSNRATTGAKGGSSTGKSKAAAKNSKQSELSLDEKLAKLGVSLD